MSDIVKFPDPDLKARRRLMAAQRRQLLRAFDRIETPERRAEAVEACVVLAVLDRNERRREGEE